MVPYLKICNVDTKMVTLPYHATKCNDMLQFTFDPITLPIHAIVVQIDRSHPVHFMQIIGDANEVIVPMKQLFHPHGRKNKKIFVFQNITVHSPTLTVHLCNSLPRLYMSEYAWDDTIVPTPGIFKVEFYQNKKLL